jgi:hypothetical protein
VVLVTDNLPVTAVVLVADNLPVTAVVLVADNLPVTAVVLVADNLPVTAVVLVAGKEGMNLGSSQTYLQLPSSEAGDRHRGPFRREEPVATIRSSYPSDRHLFRESLPVL